MPTHYDPVAGTYSLFTCDNQLRDWIWLGPWTAAPLGMVFSLLLSNCNTSVLVCSQGSGKPTPCKALYRVCSLQYDENIAPKQGTSFTWTELLSTPTNAVQDPTRFLLSSHITMHVSQPCNGSCQPGRLQKCIYQIKEICTTSVVPLTWKLMKDCSCPEAESHEIHRTARGTQFNRKNMTGAQFPCWSMAEDFAPLSLMGLQINIKDRSKSRADPHLKIYWPHALLRWAIYHVAIFFLN